MAQQELVDKRSNPFEHDPATNLTADQILDYYIEDYNYSRFIDSPMNVFLMGERGSGKTMALRYHSYSIQNRYAELHQKQFNYDKLGIYISCKTPLFLKREHDLFEDNVFKTSSIYELFLTMSIANDLLEVLKSIEVLAEDSKHKSLIEDFEYMIGENLPPKSNFFESVQLFVDKHNRILQDRLLNPEIDAPQLKAFSFYTFIKPLINFARKFDLLSKTHFLFLIDDIQDLHESQIKHLNSWIAYRDHSEFSFKLSCTKARERILLTSSGGTILEGHDFMTIDMEQPKQNSQSDYGKLARKILSRRLNKFNINTSPEDFFPENEQFLKDIDHYKQVVKDQAVIAFGESSEKRKNINDYVYKYARAEYFRDRDAKANLPPYAGLETLIHLSTGVVRNLLYPCFYMYDAVVSGAGNVPQKIEPKVQTQVIKDKSEALWAFVSNDLPTDVTDCSSEQAKQIKNILQGLMLLFKERLRQDISEPRAISFTISSYTDEAKKQLEPLLRIAREARLIYVRFGSAKDDGLREPYYTPNRLLLPIHGLDVIGQHARISIQAKELIFVAKTGKKFNSQIVIPKSKTLFDEEY